MLNNLLKRFCRSGLIVVVLISIFTVTAFAKSNVTIKKNSPVAFADIEGHWARHYIDRLFNENIINGSAKLFRPDEEITRAEAVALLLRTDRFTPDETEAIYKDVKITDWYYNAVVHGAAIGIFSDGFDVSDYFCPNAAITRSETAEIVINYLRYLGHEKQEYERAIDKMVSCNFFLEAGDDNATLTRAEMCAVITRVIDYEDTKSFYVDNAAGEDTDTGTIAMPFKTVERAQRAVKEINKGMNNNIYIYIKSGYYYCDNPITFNSEDSGMNGYSVIYSGYGEGRTIFHGAKEIKGWRIFDSDKKIYRAKLDKDIKSRQFYVNGVKAERARSIGGLSDVSFDNEGHSTTDLFLADFKRPQDLEFVYYGNWVNNRFKVSSITADNKRATIKLSNLWKQFMSGQIVGGKIPDYYENALELLDEDGEYYMDSQDGYIYYKPRSGEDMSSATAMLPIKEELVNIIGDKTEKIRNISFTNVSFAYTTWILPEMLGGLWVNQANIMNMGAGANTMFPPGAVTVKQGIGITFEKCDFYGLGATGLKMPEGIENSAIIGNEFYSISSSAISFGDDSTVHRYPNGDEQWMLFNNEISNNYIHDVAAEYQSGAGVCIGLPTNMLFKNNEIFNVPYSGMHVSIGWTGQLTSHYKDCDYLDNYIHEIGTSKLYDGGGFYSLGGPGNDDTDLLRVCGNYFENKYRVGGPLYFDEGSSNYLVENNVIDQRNVKSVDEHFKGDKAVWLFVNEASSGNIIAQNNYTTTDDTHNVFNVLMTNTTYCPEASWPPEAQEIIDNSGISEEYKYLFPDNIQKFDVNFDELLSLKSGDDFQIEVSNLTTRKNTRSGISDIPFYYSSSNSSAVSVNEKGKVTAISQGKSKVKVSIITDGVVRTKSFMVYVDDIPSEINIQKNFYNLSTGEVGVLSASMLTAISHNEVDIEKMTFVSENPSIATVDNDGTVNVISPGTVDIKVTITSQNITKTISYPVVVEETLAGISSEVNISQLAVNKSNWSFTGNAVFEESEDKLGIHTPNGSAYITNTKYNNELISFKAEFNYNGSAWPAISIRAQSDDYVIGNNNTSYLLIFKEDVIEIQRFTNGGRFVICGDIEGYTSSVGSAIVNKFTKNGQVHEIKLGAFNLEDGVRIVGFVDGVKAFDVLDNSVGAITEPGYFGISDHVNAITLSK